MFLTKAALRPHALLPRQYDERKVLASTVDAWGRALWLICHDARVPELLGVPYEALVVIGDGSRILERPLHGVTGAPARIDALPRDGFVVKPAPADRANATARSSDRTAVPGAGSPSVPICWTCWRTAGPTSGPATPTKASSGTPSARAA